MNRKLIKKSCRCDSMFNNFDMLMILLFLVE